MLSVRAHTHTLEIVMEQREWNAIKKKNNHTHIHAINTHSLTVRDTNSVTL